MRKYFYLTTLVLFFSTHFYKANAQCIANAGADKTVCTESTTLNATLSGGIGTWTGPTGVSFTPNVNAQNVQVNGLNPGQNIIVWSVVDGIDTCSDTIIVTNAKAYAGVDTVICTNTINLYALPPAVGTGLWTQQIDTNIYGNVNFANSAQYNTNITNVTPGKHTLIWRVNAGVCISRDTVNIINGTTFAGVERHVCSSSFQLTANPFAPVGSGTWSLDTANSYVPLTINNLNNPFATISGMVQDTNYVLIWTADPSSYCGGGSHSVIIRNALPTPPSITTPSHVVCGGVVHLNANHPFIGTHGMWWSIGGVTFVNSLDSNTTAMNLRPCANTLYWSTYTDSCVLTAAVVITNHAADAGTDKNLCSETATMNGCYSPLITGSWYEISGMGHINNIYSPTSQVQHLPQGTSQFVWMTDPVYLDVWVWNPDASNNANYMTETIFCPFNRDTVSIINSLPTKPLAGANQSLCGNTTVLEGNPITIGTGTWLLGTGSTATFSSTFNPQATLTNIGQGQNRLIWRATNGACTLVDTVLITNNLPTSPLAGTNTTICNDEFSLNANNPTIGIGQWSVVNGYGLFNDITIRNTTVKQLNKGSNTLRWTITNNNCALYHDVVITNDLPTEPNAGNNQIICNSSTFLQANAITLGTGSWLLGTGSVANIISPSNPHTLLTNIGQGQNTLIWRATKGSCTLQDTVFITNNLPNTPNAGPDTTICSNTFNLNASLPGAGMGQWSIVNGFGTFSNINDPQAIVSQLAYGANTLRWTIYNGDCIAYDDIVVTNNGPSMPFAGIDQVICSDSTVLQANIITNGTGQWIFTQGNVVEINNPYSAYINIPSGQNILIWEASLNNCTLRDSVIILNNSFISPSAGSDTALCNNHIMLYATPPSTGQGQWSIISGFGVFSNINAPNAIVSQLSHGNNTFRWTVGNGGCTAYDDIVITYNGPSIPNAGIDQVLCTNTTSMQANIITIGNGQWLYTQGNISDINNPLSTYTNIPPGQNMLIWQASYGSCVLSDTVYIFNNTPSLPFAGNDTTICTNQLTLNASVPVLGQGEWSIINGFGVFSNIYDPQATVYQLSHGQNTLRWRVTHNNCSSYDDIIVTNNAPSTPLAGSDQNICKDSTSLQANLINTGTGKWLYTQGVVTNIFNPHSTYTSIPSGQHLLIWESSFNNCILRDTVIITNNTPSTPNAGSDTIICQNHINLYAATPAIGQGVWSVINGFAIFSDIYNPQSSISQLSLGSNILRWTVSHQNCVLFDDIEIINLLPSEAYAGTDQTLCADSTYLQAHALNVGSGSWSIIGGNGIIAQPNNPNSFVSSLSQGNNILVWTASNSMCVLSDTVIIKNNLPSLPQTGPDTTICSNVITLYANTPAIGQGEWSIMNGYGVFNNINNPQSNLSHISQGTNVLRWKITHLNCSLYDDLIIVNDLPSIPNAGNNMYSCLDSIHLSAQQPLIGNGLWQSPTQGIQFSNAQAPQTIVSGLLAHYTTTLVWTITNNACNLSDTIYVYTSVMQTSHNVTNLSCFSSNDGNINVNVSQGFPPYNFQWYNNIGLLPYIGSHINNIPADTYYINITDSIGCVYTDSFTITQPPQILLQEQIFDLMCYNDSSGAIILNPTGGIAPYLFYWSASNGLVLDSIQNIANLPAGIYTINLTDSTACSTTATYTVNQPLPISINAEVTYNDAYNQGAIFLNVSGGTPNYTYLWSIQGAENFTSTQQNINDLSNGLYTVTVTDANNCTQVQTYEVSYGLVTDYLGLYNAFSPNGDGINDTWEIDYIDLYPKAVVKIWNQDNKLIFESAPGYPTPWDGTYKGVLLPPSTVYYVVDLKHPDIPAFVGYIRIEY